jgi:hypothetical protein
VILIGKVIASAIGRKSPGFAEGTETFIAAGTAIYEALAARIPNMNRLEISSVTNPLRYANTQPFISGMISAKNTGNQP